MTCTIHYAVRRCYSDIARQRYLGWPFTNTDNPGKNGLTPARMKEIGRSVYKNFGQRNRILVIPIQPDLID